MHTDTAHTILQATALESFAQLFPLQFAGVFQPTLKMMIDDIVQAGQQVRGCRSDSCLASYMNVLARLFFQCWEPMVAALHGMSNGNSQLLCTVLDIWFDKFDCISFTYKRKLSALATCHILTSSDPAVTKEPTIQNVTFFASVSCCRRKSSREFHCLVTAFSFKDNK